LPAAPLTGTWFTAEVLPPAPGVTAACCEAVSVASIAFFLSDDASYVTASTLLVDAGFIVNAEL